MEDDIPITKYFEMDVAFLGLRGPNGGSLVVKDPSDQEQTKKKGKLQWNHQVGHDKIGISGIHQKVPCRSV